MKVVKKAATLQEPIIERNRSDEAQRLQVVRRYDILDTPPDGAFDHITAIAASLFSAPIAIISVVDSNRIWFKSHYGIDVAEIKREPGLCASAILQDTPWLLNDAKRDPRSLANSLVAGEFGLRFYLGIPLRTHDGFNLGTLCVIDRKARTVSVKQIELLRNLATIVMDELELRLAAQSVIGELKATLAEKESARIRAEITAAEIGHRIGNSLNLVSSLLQLQAMLTSTEATRAELLTAVGRIAAVSRVHHQVSHKAGDEIISTTKYLNILCSDLTTILGFPVEEVVLEGAGEIRFRAESIGSLGLIVNEMATNAAKYGATAVSVALRMCLDGQLELSVTDNGRGLQENFDPKSSTGLGMKVISTSASHLGGALEYRCPGNGTGAIFTVKFPAKYVQ